MTIKKRSYLPCCALGLTGKFNFFFFPGLPHASHFTYGREEGAKTKWKEWGKGFFAFSFDHLPLALHFICGREGGDRKQNGRGEEGFPFIWLRPLLAVFLGWLNFCTSTMILHNSRKKGGGLRGALGTLHTNIPFFLTVIYRVYSLGAISRFCFARSCHFCAEILLCAFKGGGVVIRFTTALYPAGKGGKHHTNK